MELKLQLLDSFHVHGSDGKDDGLFKMKLGDFMKLYSSVYVGG